MNRREFLKIGSLSTAALLIQFKHIPIKFLNRPALIEHQRKIYRATPAGEIQVSHDLGKTWQLHLHLGKEYSVTAFFKDVWQHLHARVSFSGREFDLTLAPGSKYWLST